jgi:hypothetical protein
MRSTIYFNGTEFPPSFGYLEAFSVCEAVNLENPTWCVELQFDATSNFSFASFNVTADELNDAVMVKLVPLKGPKQLPAFDFPLTKQVQLDENNKVVFHPKV